MTNKTREEMLNTSIDEAERLNRLRRQLLDMTQLDAGALKPKREPCDLHDLVGAALRRCAKQLAQHKVKLSDSRQPADLMLDDVLMEQVLANLLDNASSTPRPAPPSRWSPHSTSSACWSRCATKARHSEGDLQKVFDKFFRARAAGDRGRGGTPGSGHLPRLRRSHGRTHLRPQPHRSAAQSQGRRIRHRVLARSDRRTPRTEIA